MGSSGGSSDAPKVQPAIAPVSRESEEVRRKADETRRKFAQTSRQKSNIVQNYSPIQTGKLTTGGGI